MCARPAHGPVDERVDDEPSLLEPNVIERYFKKLAHSAARTVAGQDVPCSNLRTMRRSARSHGKSGQAACLYGRDLMLEQHGYIAKPFQTTAKDSLQLGLIK